MTRLIRLDKYLEIRYRWKCRHCTIWYAYL